MPSTMKPAEVLLDRLHAMGLPIEPTWSVKRTGAGSVQLRAGAWSWRVVGEDGLPVMLPGGACIGSVETVTRLAKAPVLSAEVDPYSRDIEVFEGEPPVGRKTWTHRKGS